MPSARSIVKAPLRLAKRMAKKVVKKAMAQLPLSPERLTGKLAKDGGRAVRNTQLRPWPSYPASSVWAWVRDVGPTMRDIFCSGQEGLPQPLANEFAQKWAAYCGARHALLLPHGTDALRVALAAALDHDGLEYGGEVIVPNLSFIASATAALDRRMGVALVDVDPETLNTDPRRVEEAIIPGKTRAIVAVHLFGQPADMAALRDIANRHALMLIEDAAQAHGAIHALGRVGTLGDAAAFSFQSSKNLPSGEGGAFCTNDSEIFERAYAFHNVGRARVGGLRWGHEFLGWNCRPTEYVAAVLLHRLRTLEREQETRYVRFLSLRKHLEGVSSVEPLGVHPGTQRHAVHMFVLRYRPEYCDGLEVKTFLRALWQEGIPIGRAYELTLSQQPALQRLAEKQPDYLRFFSTPVADQAVKQLIYLPHNLFLGSEADMAEIAAAFRKVQAYYAPQSVQQVRPALQPLSSPALDVPQAPLARPLGPKPLRFGIAGIGVMGRLHAEAILGNSRLALVGVSDAQPQTGREAAAKFGCKWFSSPKELIQSGEVDALVVATPHWEHAELSIAGLQAGLHVVCEKPLTVTVAQADDVVRVAAQSSGIFAVVHQTRFEPSYQYVKRLLDSGELGPIYRCSMEESSWRTEAYYRSSPWRGTWKGEGGGVLLNQAPHLLDQYVWLCGMPETVIARCDTTLHRIEVEDTASAILHHANAAHGFIHINTSECPAVSRKVIVCDRGRIVVDSGKVCVTKLRDSIRDKTVNETRLYGDLENETREIHFGSSSTLLHAFYVDLVAAVTGKGKLTCPGEEGRNAVELANAMILSSNRAAAVSLPLDREEYSQLIGSLVNCESPLQVAAARQRR